MSSHRYWRVLVTASAGGGDTACNELELRSSSGGANLTGTGTPISGSEYSAGYADDYAFDGNAANSWNSSGGLGTTAWIGYDFGAGNAHDIIEIAFKARGDYVGNAPTDMQVEYSDDGSSWTTKWSITGQTGWSTNETRVFTEPVPPTAGVPHRYWRVYVTANNSNGTTGYAGFLELEMREALGGADQCTGGTASASGVDAGNVAANAFDNDTATRWYSSGTLPSWIRYDFGAGNEKNIIEFAAKSPGVQQYTPRDFQLQFSDDGSTWGTLITVKGETNWLGTATFTVWSADTRYDTGSAGQMWRINMTGQQAGATTFSLTEVQMRITPGGADQCSGGYGFASSMDDTSIFGAFAAFDDNAGTQWQAYSDGEVPSWLIYKFASAKAIVEVLMSAPGGGNEAWAPANFTIDRWNGSTWEAQYTASGLTWTGSETKTFTFGSAPSSARPVVFVCT